MKMYPFTPYSKKLFRGSIDSLKAEIEDSFRERVTFTSIKTNCQKHKLMTFRYEIFEKYLKTGVKLHILISSFYRSEDSPAVGL